MAGAGGDGWYVSSCGWTNVKGEKIRLFAVTRDGEFLGVIGSPHYASVTDILVMAGQIEWPERPETIEEYIKRTEAK